jgi:2-polyprenyl-3-methyl-5-hydroxy-6-metoxy-1,4-benzoquinol methylase
LIEENKIYIDFPEQKLSGRIKFSYDNLPEKVEKLLDAGCSYGYGTKYFSEKSKETYGIDISEEHIRIAQSKYPYIFFSCKTTEDTGFESDFFDAIVFNDVLEHTKDKIKSLSELFRILKNNGTIIISTPNKGLFGFLDPYNYGYYLRKLFPFIYKFLYKVIRFFKEGKFPKEYNPEHLEKHYHYSLNNLIELLESSDFKGNYEIKKVFRSGLFIEVFTMNLEVFLSIFLKKKIRDKILKPFVWLSEQDYKIPYGVFAYNIAIVLVKKTNKI